MKNITDKEKKVLKLTEREINEIFQLREKLHKHPETAYKEKKTQEILVNFIKKHTGKNTAFSFHKPFRTSFVVEYSVVPGEKYSLFRADMDALPVDEKNCKRKIVSGNPGIMHACGHDIHMSVLAGFILLTARTNPRKNMIFVFQPAEEGAGGAMGLLKTGFFESFDIKSAFALHVSDDFPYGTAASNGSTLFAMPKELDLIFKGKQAHGAMPAKGSDAIASASLFLSEIKKQIAAKLPPTEPVLLHTGKIFGGSARNIVAKECSLFSTLRTPSKKIMDEAVKIIRKTASLSAKLYNGEVEIMERGEYIPVINNPKLFEKLKKAGQNAGIPVKETEMKMVGEDFGFFTDRYPGLLFWLGTAEKNRPPAPLHSPDFYPENRNILNGIRLFNSISEII